VKGREIRNRACLRLREHTTKKKIRIIGLSSLSETNWELNIESLRELDQWGKTTELWTIETVALGQRSDVDCRIFVAAGQTKRDSQESLTCLFPKKNVSFLGKVSGLRVLEKRRGERASEL